MFPASDKVWSALSILDHPTESVLSQQVASALGLTHVQCACSDDVRSQDHVRLDKPWHLMLCVWYEMLSSLNCSYTSTQGASRQVCSTACCGSSTHCEIQCCYRGMRPCSPGAGAESQGMGACGSYTLATIPIAVSVGSVGKMAGIRAEVQVCVREAQWRREDPSGGRRGMSCPEHSQDCDTDSCLWREARPTVAAR